MVKELLCTYSLVIFYCYRIHEENINCTLSSMNMMGLIEMKLLLNLFEVCKNIKEQKKKENILFSFWYFSYPYELTLKALMYISCTITNNTKVIDLYTALLAIYYLQTVNVKKLFTSQNIPRVFRFVVPWKYLNRNLNLNHLICIHIFWIELYIKNGMRNENII